MKKKRTPMKKINPSSALRASVSFPTPLYRTLEEIAKQKKVSFAWVVRDAAEKYVAVQQPDLAVTTSSGKSRVPR
ncbi:MAG: CopG family transcriptional regulator [Candidatus Micrarchaeaceae archaeon]